MEEQEEKSIGVKEDNKWGSNPKSVN